MENALRIEAPTEADIDRVARALVHAQQVTLDVLGAKMDGTRKDISLIQQLLDTRTIERESTYTLHALGLAFGRAFLHENEGFDWWMVEDERGRDPVIRYRNSTLLTYPKTMISKRIEDGEHPNVTELFEQLGARLAELIAEGYGER